METTIDDVFRGLGIEVDLPSPDDFNKIVETLTRIGFASRDQMKLFQSCHILHKRGRYAIVHFKEMFAMDGKQTDINDSDIERRNRITRYMQDWGLLTIVDEDSIVNTNGADPGYIKIIPHREKSKWELIPKYSIGNQ